MKTNQQIRPFLALVAFAINLAAASAHAQEKLSAGSLVAASCAACHNTQGRSVQGTPVIAGIPRESFITTFKEFRSGARPATVMHRHAKGYNDQEVELLADYFAAQKR